MSTNIYRLSINYYFLAIIIKTDRIFWGLVDSIAAEKIVFDFLNENGKLKIRVLESVVKNCSNMENNYGKRYII